MTKVAIITAMLLWIYIPASATERVNLHSAETVFSAEKAGDQVGYSLSNSGDVNGDGFDDILIGAPKSDEAGQDAGQVYLFFGRSEGWLREIDLSQADASFVGETEDDEAGLVCIPGDVNGDGYDDILIGAPQNDRNRIDAGQTYLIFGKQYGWETNTSLANADASFVGEHEGDRSGWPIAEGGDVNGDGYDDLLISAPLNDAGGEDTGQTYLIFGKPSGWMKHTSLSRSDASFVGQVPGNQSAYSQFKTGDVNGDGYNDLLLCSWRNGESCGQSYVLFGKPSGWSMLFPLFRSDASFTGENEGDMSGYAACGVGDINGDGYGDMMIGAPGSDRGGEDAGQAYLVLGSPNGWAKEVSLSAADASFVGENAGDKLGFSICGDDYDQDGYTDLLIGAPFSDKKGHNTGQSYLIMEAADELSMYEDVDKADITFYGENDEAQSGYAVSGNGDVNGDGYPDVLIAAPRSLIGGKDTGSTYLILTSSPRLCLDPDSLDFGDKDENQTITLMNCGIGELSWEIECEESWCTVFPQRGVIRVGAEEIEVTVNRIGLDLGVYSCSLWVGSAGGDEDIIVTMEVSEIPKLCVEPLTLDFGDFKTTEVLTIHNCGTGTLDWNLTVDQNWITLNQTTGALTSESAQIVVTVNRGELELGDYTGTITITSNGGDQQASVSLTKKPSPKIEEE